MMTRLRVTIATIVIAVLVTACGSTESTIPFEDLPATGDPVRGERIYTNVAQPACSSCHVNEQAGAPALDDYDAELAASRVEGQDAREYTFYAIVEPAQYIVEGYGNAMPNRYDEALEPQDIADMIAYMLADNSDDDE